MLRFCIVPAICALLLGGLPPAKAVEFEHQKACSSVYVAAQALAKEMDGLVQFSYDTNRGIWLLIVALPDEEARLQLGLLLGRLCSKYGLVEVHIAPAHSDTIDVIETRDLLNLTFGDF
jgi:hypothetical protein